MDTFLKLVSLDLKDQWGDRIHEKTLIVPNQRAIIFLQKTLNEAYNKTIICPSIITIEELLNQLTDINIVEPTKLLFEFYQVYKSSSSSEPQSFEEFSTWSVTLMQDFQDLDRHFVNTELFFPFIYEYFSLSQWSTESHELSDFQKRYLHFWKDIKTYYLLLEEIFEKEKIGHQGYVLKKVLQSLLEKDSVITHKCLNTSPIFIGFNALTRGEITLLDHLFKNSMAWAYFDADSYYVENEIHEAGLFIRKFLEKDSWKKRIKIIYSHGFENNKSVRLWPVNGHVLQAKLACHLLEAPSSKQNDWNNTAIILNDENLLIPLLNALPSDASKINVTIGFPIKNIPFYQFLLKAFDAYSWHEKEGYFYHKHITDIIKLATPFLSEKEREISFELLTQIQQKNLIRIYPSFLKNSSLDILNNLILIGLSDLNLGIEKLIIWLENLFNQIVKKNSTTEEKIWLESIHLVIKSLQQIIVYSTKYDFINRWSIIKALFDQLSKSNTIPFIGEPLQGLQIMGMLESRLLDFEEVILLSVNEGSIPKEKFEDSFIPFEIRKKFDLSTHIEKDAVYSYHFYRLIQRAKKVELIYNNSSGDDFSKIEPSRYILQLDYEWPKYNPLAKIEKKELFQHLPSLPAQTLSIEKTDLIILKIKSFLTTQGLSPSAINTYIRCPLDFYHQYILGIKEEKKVEEDMEESSLGNIIHRILEKLYTPFIGSYLSADCYEKMFQRLELLIQQEVALFYQQSDGLKGRAFLDYELIHQVVRLFLTEEKNILNKTQQKIILNQLESSLSCVFDHPEVKVTFKGIVDRIDIREGLWYIIDYKTGRFDGEKTILKDLQELLNPSYEKHQKIIQLLCYSYLIYQKEGVLNTHSGIYYLKKIKDGFVPLRIESHTQVDHEAILVFEELIKKLISEMLDMNTPFTHRTKSTYCLFCS